MTDPGLVRQLYGQQTEPHINETQEVQMGSSCVLMRDGLDREMLVRSPGTSIGARMVTAHIGVKPPAPEDWPEEGDRSLPLVAEVRWGNGAGEFRAEVDAKQGTTISLVASYLDILVRYESAFSTPDGRALRASVSAALVWGTRGGWAAPTRTRRLALPAAGGPVTVPIPSFAASVNLLANDGAWYASGDTITVHGGPAPADDPILVETPVIAGGAPFLTTNAGIALSRTARYLTIDHTAGAPVVVRAVFGLAL